MQYIDRLWSLVAYSNGNRAVEASAFGRLSQENQTTSEVLVSADGLSVGCIAVVRVHTSHESSARAIYRPFEEPGGLQ